VNYRQILGRFVSGTAVLLACATPAFGQSVETKLLVRAVSHDAKIIGSNVGGAEITIRDAQTGDVLARGTQLGSTGSTELIMTKPRERGETVFDTEDAGGYLATVELAAPKLLEVTAEGPLGTPQAMQRSSKTIWLVPGRDVLGEGLVLVLNGFTIRLESPLPDGTSPAGEPIGVRVHVEMLCGCPLTPGGMWDSDRIEILARVLSEGEVISETPLTYLGERSKFGGAVVAPEAGVYELEVLAIDTQRANFGRLVHRVTVTGG
jgi:hypothetical protein